MKTELRTADDGSAALFVVIVTGALLLMAGLVYDGAEKIHAIQAADAVAAEAARAAGQAVDLTSMATSRGLQVDHAAARRAALAYLGQAGVTGSVSFPAADTLAVDTAASVPTTFLGIIGIDQVSATGHAEARLYDLPEQVQP